MSSKALPAVFELIDEGYQLSRRRRLRGFALMFVLLAPLEFMFALTTRLTIGPLLKAVQAANGDFRQLPDVAAVYGSLVNFLFALLVLMVFLSLYSLVSPMANAVLVIDLEAIRQGRSLPLDRLGARFLERLWDFLGVVIFSVFWVTLGFLFFLLPGIWLSLALSQAELRALVGGEQSTAALGSSRRLMAPLAAKWRYLELVIVGLIGWSLLSQVVSVGLGLLGLDSSTSLLAATLERLVPAVLLSPLFVAVRLAFLKAVEQGAEGGAPARRANSTPSQLDDVAPLETSSHFPSSRLSGRSTVDTQTGLDAGVGLWHQTRASSEDREESPGWSGWGSAESSASSENAGPDASTHRPGASDHHATGDTGAGSGSPEGEVEPTEAPTMTPTVPPDGRDSGGFSHPLGGDSWPDSAGHSSGSSDMSHSDHSSSDWGGSDSGGGDSGGWEGGGWGGE